VIKIHSSKGKDAKYTKLHKRELKQTNIISKKNDLILTNISLGEKYAFFNRIYIMLTKINT